MQGRKFLALTSYQASSFSLARILFYYYHIKISPNLEGNPEHEGLQKASKSSKKKILSTNYRLCFRGRRRYRIYIASLFGRMQIIWIVICIFDILFVLFRWRWPYIVAVKRWSRWLVRDSRRRRPPLRLCDSLRYSFGWVLWRDYLIAAVWISLTW